MTALATPAWDETPPAPAPGDLVIDPATMPENRHHLIPGFADPVWPVTFTSSNPSAAELRLHWATFPDRLREQFRLAAWALLNFPVPDRALALRGAAMRPRLSTLRLYQTVTNWRTFATWLDGRGITGLAQASTQVLTDYSIYLARTRKVSRNTAINHLVALTRLHAYGPHLPGEARIGAPAWDSEGLDDYLPAATAAGENATEPISPATMGPLLVWALKFTEEFAADILAAHEEERRLRQVIERHLAQPLPHGPRPPTLAAYLEDLQAHGKPLPAQPATRGPGSHGVATQYIAAVLDCDPRTVQRELRKEHWRRYLAQHPGGCPLDGPVTGRIDGEPWTDAIAFGQAGSMTRHLVTACFVVIAYLTGMRSTEALALETGCCPDPGGTEARSSEARRHLIRARQFKTARDDDGNHLSAGVTREAPWIAVPQVMTAIRILERLAGPSGLLFPTDRGTRPGRSLAFSTMGGRIEDLIVWVNERTARPGRDRVFPVPPHPGLAHRPPSGRPGGPRGPVRAPADGSQPRLRLTPARRHPPAPGPGDRPRGRRAPQRGPRRPAARRRGLRPGGPPPDPRGPRGTPPLRRHARHAPPGQGPAVRPRADRVRERRRLPDLQLRPDTRTLQPQATPQTAPRARRAWTAARPPARTSPAPTATHGSSARRLNASAARRTRP